MIWEAFGENAKKCGLCEARKRTQIDDFMKIQKILTILNVTKNTPLFLCKGYKNRGFLCDLQKTSRTLFVLEIG